MKRAVIFGAAVILVFSMWPLRAVNAFCCSGVMFGGFIAAMYLGRSQNGLLESTMGLRAGAYAGLVASVFAIVLTMIGTSLMASPLVLDSIPAVVYDFVYPLWGGIVDIRANGGTSAPGEPGLLWRVFFQIPINALFGAFGGAVAASMFRTEPPIEAS